MAGTHISTQNPHLNTPAEGASATSTKAQSIKVQRLERQEEFPHRNSGEHGSENAYFENSQPASPEIHPSKSDDSKCLGATGKDIASQGAGATEFTPEVREIIESWLT